MMWTTISTGSAFIVLALVYRYVLYPAFLSPLAKIPSANVIARVSPAWILWKRYRCLENRSIHAAHAQHGPIVRLGPNEVSVNCVEGLRTIYGSFEKHQWYEFFDNYGYVWTTADSVSNMFSTLTGKAHAQRKRMLSNVYAKSTISRSTDFADACNTILERIHPHLKSPTNLYQVFNYTTMDIVTAYMFGKGTDFLRDQKEADWWLNLYSSRKSLTFWPQEFPRLTFVLSLAGIHLSPPWVADANRQLEEWCLKLCTQGPVHSQLSTLGPLSRASEMLDHLAAGHETSAITLAFLFYELCRNPSLQDELRRELETDSDELLQAVILETLRLYPAIPGPQPRVSRDSTILDYHIPSGVRISSSPYSLHRATVFPSPESFTPERWRQSTPAMHRHLWAFSSGGRMCIGSNLAMHQIKLITSFLIKRYRFTTQSTIEQQDAYTAAPIGDLIVKSINLEDVPDTHTLRHS